MLEILLLFFLTRNIGELALRKGLPPVRWKIYTILAWILFEVIGTLLGILLFGFDPSDFFGLMMFAVAVAFGGYLFVRRILESKPDVDESM
jgi:uncharacterized membrane protein YfcA